MAEIVKAKKTLALKNRLGDLRAIHEGDECVIRPDLRRSNKFIVIVPHRHGGKEIILPYTYIDCFTDVPSEKELEDMVFDNAIYPVFGDEEIEPDGFSSEGWPSWLMALGIV